VQRLATDSVINLRGSPIVSSLPTQPLPTPQIIVAGASASADPIIALKPTGGILWTAGKSQGISTVSANMAYDPTPSSDVSHPTPMLYMLGSAALYAMHVAVSVDKAGVVTYGVDKYYSCSTQSVGSPAIAVGGASARVLVSDASAKVVAAFGGTPSVNGTGCNGIPATAQLPSAQGTASLGPVTIGSAGAVYYAYDNTATVNGDSGVATTTFNGTTFLAPVAHNLGVIPSVNGGTLSSVSIADSFFFADSSAKLYRSYTSALAPNWSSPTFAGASSTPSAPPTVYRGFVYGVAGGTGRLYAYRKVDATPPAVGGGGSLAWSYLSGTSLGSVSPVSPGADGKLYFSDGGNNEFVAIDPSTGTSTTSPNVLWRFTGPTSVALSGVGTEATIDSNGIVYFGQDSGNVYALITDVVGDTTPPTGLGADWPRTGFDRCNSSNTAFSCQ
jgi:hypothetical protein